MGKTLINMSFAAFTALAAVLVPSTAAQAQSATYLGENADTCAIFRAMSREIPQNCSTEPVSRGLVTFANQADGAPQTRSVVWQGQAQQSVVQQAAPTDLAVAMKIHFEYDSARLSPQAGQLLDKVAAVLANDIMGQTRIRIEGHADQRGGDAYNQALSERRAQSVANYLIQNHGIDPYRLFIIGRGEGKPFDAANPESAVNRRVEFWNIGG